MENRINKPHQALRSKERKSSTIRNEKAKKIEFFQKIKNKKSKICFLIKLKLY